jgi:glycogen synthase
MATMSGEISLAQARHGPNVTAISVIPPELASKTDLARRVSPVRFETSSGVEEVGVLEGQLSDSSARLLGLSLPAPPVMTLDESLSPPQEQVEEQRIWCSRFAAAALSLRSSLGIRPDVVHLHGESVCLALHWPQSADSPPPAMVLSFYDPQKEAVFGPQALEPDLGPSNISTEESEDSTEDTGDEKIEMGGGGLPTAAQAAIQISSAVLLPSEGAKRQVRFSRRRTALKPAFTSHPLTAGAMGGVDSGRFNPGNDPDLAATFGPNDIDGKAKCKRALQDSAGLSPRDDVIVAVGAMGTNREDGTRCLVAAAQELLDADVQLVLLGDPPAEQARLIEEVSKSQPSRISVMGWSSLPLPVILAGADVVVATDDWAPWGRQAQLGMAMGCVPIVHDVGGLSDLVVDWDPATRTGGGFKLRDAEPSQLLNGVQRAQELFANQTLWKQMISRNMEQTLLWQDAWKRFDEIYREVLDED